MFILIAVVIFHYIIRKYPRTKETRRCLILLHSVKHSMFTRVSAKLFVDEGNVHMAQVESWKNRPKNIDGFYTKTTQKRGFSRHCVKIKKKMLYRPTPFFNT